ncbi:bifunctional Thioredoxin-like superfamily/mRNA capping enzyme [Babesia duncani]|uniref:mRNA guanylyltransferase n=1 Tax=Babesia duncani TaxID=323732 RepID=A0AAD9PKN5_9APIC|nr:bifunctional Thioredoxin-like superfamily/mRNA capping enzyme [Babesia duncani]
MNRESLPGIPIQDQNIQNQILSKVRGLCYYEKKAFPGSHPVSFARNSMSKIQLNSYVVCEKSDGIRALLFAASGCVFLIGRKEEVHKINIRLPVRGASSELQQLTLLDGEVVWDTLFEDNVIIHCARYLVYDAIVIHRHHMHNYNLIDRLCSAYSDVIQPAYRDTESLYDPNDPDNTIDIYLKDFYSIRDVKAIEKLIKVIPHLSDGLIFTPVAKKYTPGTFDDLLKWKPPHLNTVDFSVDVIYDEKNCPRFMELYVLRYGTRVRYSELLSPYGEVYKELLEWSLREKISQKIVECSWINDNRVWTFIPNKKYLSGNSSDERFQYDFDKGTWVPGGWYAERIRVDKDKPNSIHVVTNMEYGRCFIVASIFSISLGYFPFAYANLVDFSKHDLHLATPQNFTSKVKVARNSKATAVFYCKPSDSKIRQLIDKELNAAASDLKGIIDISVVDCSSDPSAKLCSMELGQNWSTPVLRVYPKLPMPAYNFKGPLERLKIRRELIRHVSCNVKKLDSKELPLFLSSYEVMPKVLYFGEEKEPSYKYCALSIAFDKKLYLGYINVKEHPELQKQYKVKQTPQMIVIKTDTKVDYYKGETKYSEMFEWLNVYAETFLLGGGYHDQGKGTNSKVWKFDPLPEINLESHMDLCFNKAHGFCIIYLSHGTITGDMKNMLIEFSNRYKEELTGKWMWMNLDLQTEFASLFGNPRYDSIAIFNPKKRLRYVALQGDQPLERKDIETLIEKVLGGDARFTLIKGSLPSFALIKEEL